MTRLLLVLLLAAACCGCTPEPKKPDPPRILDVKIDSVAGHGDRFCLVEYVAQDSLGRIIIYSRTFLPNNMMTTDASPRWERNSFGNDASVYAIRYADSLRKLMVVR